MRYDIKGMPMSFSEQKNDQILTLAEWLGMTRHISPLLQQLKRVKQDVNVMTQWLMNIAYARGASAYPRPPATPEEIQQASDFSDEEIAVALCHPDLPVDMIRIRMTAQLMSKKNTDAAGFARLIKMERTERIFRHIVVCANKIIPHHPLWDRLSESFGNTPLPESGKLPHWSRFAFVTGLTRSGHGKTIWLENCHEK